MKNHAKRGVKRHNSPAPPPFQDPPKEDFVWQGTSSPGVGVLRFNGAAWETGWHFCPRDSLNVIINQPTSLFFEATMESLWASREDTVMGCIAVLPLISSFLYQGWPPRTSSIRLRPACSVKVDSVIV